MEAVQLFLPLGQPTNPEQRRLLTILIIIFFLSFLLLSDLSENSIESQAASPGWLAG